MVTIPKHVFEETERLAAHLKVSRSELYARALEEYTRGHADEDVSQSYNEVFGSPTVTQDPGLSAELRQAAVRRAFKQTDSAAAAPS